MRRSPRNHVASPPAAHYVAEARRFLPGNTSSCPRNFTHDCWLEHLPNSSDERDLAIADFCQLIKLKTGCDTTILFTDASCAL